MSNEVHRNRVLPERKAAEYLGICYSKLCKSRRDGARTGHMPPVPYIKCGRSILYRQSDLDTYILKHRKDFSNSQAS